MAVECITVFFGENRRCDEKTAYSVATACGEPDLWVGASVVPVLEQLHVDLPLRAWDGARCQGVPKG